MVGEGGGQVRAGQGGGGAGARVTQRKSIGNSLKQIMCIII